MSNRFMKTIESICSMAPILLAAGYAFSAGMAAAAAPPLDQASPQVRDYHFDRTISRKVLENYLSRSISVEGVFNGRGDLDDNLRMLKSMPDGACACGAPRTTFWPISNGRDSRRPRPWLPIPK
jgi:hypothetical protein